MGLPNAHEQKPGTNSCNFFHLQTMVVSFFSKKTTDSKNFRAGWWVGENDRSKKGVHSCSLLKLLTFFGDNFPGEG